MTEEKNWGMGWASRHIERLKAGETVQFRPHGNSMIPKIQSGQLCTVAPVDVSTVEVGDIVLCKVNGAQYVHLVSAKRDGQFQISNNKGHVNGWISSTAVFGKLVKVEP